LDERLHKVLAQHGIGSRRQVEAWIREGRVLVNGRPAAIGQQVRPSDRIVVDGRDVTRKVAAPRTLRVIVCHKPSGEMSRAHEGDDRVGVDARLPSLRAGRWLPVNALGFGEEGLLVLTNDGALAAAVARRGKSLPVEYRARVLRPRDGDPWPALPGGVEVEGQHCALSTIERLEGAGTNVWFRVGAERPLPRGAVRALFDSAGLKVNRILLVRWGPVTLPRDLPRGRSRELAGTELGALLEQAGRPDLARGSRPVAGRAARGGSRPTNRGSRPKGPGRGSTARRSDGQ
jgi:23S rRNA pseudouridine2605 synthase